MFFSEQGIILPKGFNWQNVKANIFEVIDGKKILFENHDSLFQRLKEGDDLKINRERIANNMTADHLHNDIINFFEFLTSVAQ